MGVPAAQLRRRSLPVSDPDRAAHGSRAVPRPSPRDAPQRGALYDRARRDPRGPALRHASPRPAKRLRRR